MKQYWKIKSEELIECACGCGELINAYVMNGRKRVYRRFKSRHNTRKKIIVQKVIHNGYVDVYQPKHPFANAHGRVKEHRLVVEKHLNCILLPWAVVHHINEDRIDNRIENLMVTNGPEHISNHMKIIVKTRTRDNKGRFVQSTHVGTSVK